MKHRVLIGVLATTVVLLLGVLAMYAFGAPQASAPEVAATQVTTSQPAEVPAPDPNSPLMIEIPGCVCHSDDPALVKEHQGYRMNQCFGCHTGGMPEMGQ